MAFVYAPLVPILNTMFIYQGLCVKGAKEMVSGESAFTGISRPAVTALVGGKIWYLKVV